MGTTSLVPSIGDSEKRGGSVDGNYYIVLATTTIAFQLPR